MIARLGRPNWHSVLQRYRSPERTGPLLRWDQDGLRLDRYRRLRVVQVKTIACSRIGSSTVPVRATPDAEPSGLDWSGFLACPSRNLSTCEKKSQKQELGQFLEANSQSIGREER